MKSPKGKPQPPTQQAETLMRLIITNSINCKLCGKPSAALYYFTPGDPEAYGGTPGRQRMLPYGLCEEHLNDQQSLERVEEKIEVELKSQFCCFWIELDVDGRMMPIFQAHAPQPSFN
jgi:hypothetical protein